MPLEQTAKVNGLIKEAHKRGLIPDPKHIEKTLAGSDKVSLPKQHIPEGFEAIDAVPDWANPTTATSRVQRIRSANLKHALRIKGTNHVFTSDIQLSKPALESLVSDYKVAIGAIGRKFPDGVNMHIPSGSNGYSPRNARGWTWESPGLRSFFIRPGLARNADEQRYQADNKSYRERQEKIAAAGFASAGLSKPANVHSWSMPANEKNGRAYTMVHEMGHILDHMNNHTGGRFGVMSIKHDHGVWQRNKLDLSAYGRTSAVEGYAEAAAQYFLGGKGSNKAADDYAKTFGW